MTSRFLGVTVAVYDTQGRRVRTLFDGVIEAGHERTFVLEADALASGLYLCRITGASFAETRPVLLVK